MYEIEGFKVCEHKKNSFYLMKNCVRQFFGETRTAVRLMSYGN